VVDTLGLLIVVLVTAASVGGPRRRAPCAGPGLDGHAVAGAGLRRGVATPGGWSPGPNRSRASCSRSCANPKGQRGFAVLPRRWVVERTLSWLTTHRRLARDYERLPEHAEAWVKWSMIGVMVRRLAPTPGRISWT